MKRNILVFIIVLTALSLTAFNLINWGNIESAGVDASIDPVKAIDNSSESNPGVEDYTPVFEEADKTAETEFFFDIGNRFNSIKKSELDKARSFSDFVGEEHANRIVSYKLLKVIVLEDSKQTSRQELGESGELNPAQLELLQSADYSTNLLIWADYREKNVETGLIEDSYWTPYITVVPETQAVYSEGKDALINYLRQNSKQETDKVVTGNIMAGKLYFTVTKAGKISNVRVMATSGFPEVDSKLIELASNLPGNWEPAKNMYGENIDQDLVISFGNMGC